MFDVTVIGPAVVDVLAAPFDMEAVNQGLRDIDRIKMSFGGDALNESVVLTRLGKKVQLVSKIGDDEAGKSILGFLRKNGVSTDGILVEEGLETAINIALVAPDGSRKFLMNPHSSLRRLGPEDVMSGVEGYARMVCFASMFISPLFTIEKMEALFRQIRAAGRTLLVDMTRPKNGETFEDLKALFPLMDIFVPNDEEISLLTGVQDPEENVRLLVGAGVKHAVVKIGKEGCLIGSKDGILHVPAVRGVPCIDTTGAGDTFAAGLAAGLVSGWTISESARLACAAASCSIGEVGATDGVRSMEQVMERYRTIPC